MFGRPLLPDEVSRRPVLVLVVVVARLELPAPMEGAIEGSIAPPAGLLLALRKCLGKLW